jgi:hypothetical protein
MEIAEIFRRYTDQVCEIHLYQRVLKTNAQKEYEGVIQFGRQQEKIWEEHGVPKEIPLSTHNFFFRTAQFNQQDFFYGYKERRLEDQKRAVWRHKNKQYQWLLAEAYELFEDFIESAYGFAGSADRNFWPLSDFGNISLLELEKQNFDWFVSQAKKSTPQKILNRFRYKFPQLEWLETHNNLNRNLHLAIILIENLRHVIVHQKGIVSDRGKFIQKVLRESGLQNNGKPSGRNTEFIEAFIGSGDHENVIYLLEIPTDPTFPRGTHIDIFEHLSNLLMAYALIIAECLDPNYGNANSITSSQ